MMRILIMLCMFQPAGGEASFLARIVYVCDMKPERL